jgi:hypothetical protein
MSSLFRFGPIALAAVFAASTAYARPVTVETACPPIDPPIVFAAPPAGGVRVFIDPVTGKTRPATPEERRKVAEATARDRSARTYEMEIRPDGTRIVPLDDAFRMNLVATVHPDGTITYGCAPGGAPAKKPSETSK